MGNKWEELRKIKCQAKHPKHKGALKQTKQNKKAGQASNTALKRKAESPVSLNPAPAGTSMGLHIGFKGLKHV